LLKISDPGPQHPLQTPEVPQQRPPLRGPESRYRLEDRLVEAARALATVSGDREAMRFVADPLDEPQRR
jgi:hypothetical protein